MSLDETKKAQICAMLAVGCSLATAARYVGCCVKTIYNACEADLHFLDQMDHAAAEAELAALNSVQAGAKTSWRAAAWLLQSIKPSCYHRRAGVKPPRPKPSWGGGFDIEAARQKLAQRTLESSAKVVTK